MCLRYKQLKKYRECEEKKGKKEIKQKKDIKLIKVKGYINFFFNSSHVEIDRK